MTPLPPTVDSEPSALATASEFERYYPELAANLDPDQIQQLMVEATANIEARVSRRLAPFTNMIYQDRMEGIDPDEYGNTADMPLDIYGSLGMSQSVALGASSLVRHVWLDQYAPLYPNLWTYNVQSVTIYRTFGDSQALDITAEGGLRGPDASDGHLWLRIGTFAPVGSRIDIRYGGGYTVQVPSDLRRACRMQAAYYAVLDAEPQQRREMNLTEMQDGITLLIAPWVRA